MQSLFRSILPNIIKIDPYNFELYSFIFGAFFEIQCIFAFHYKKFSAKDVEYVGYIKTVITWEKRWWLRTNCECFRVVWTAAVWTLMRWNPTGILHFRLVRYCEGYVYYCNVQVYH